jgi:adenine-specific DNA-methyltransferase
LFANKKEAGRQKLRGGYYTPLGLAEYLVQWAVRCRGESILEPSCGDGNFIRAVLSHLNGFPADTTQTRIVAVEIDEREIGKAQERVSAVPPNGANLEWVCGDFFHAFDRLMQEKFDVILGNPPFIRFQYFDETSRDAAFAHLRGFGYKPTKLANVWSAFVQLSVELLKAGGRLAMVVPAELLQVKYAAELRARLAQSFERITLVGFKRLVFSDIQQEVLLLLAEGKVELPMTQASIYTVEYEDGPALFDGQFYRELSQHKPAKYYHSQMKWTSLFLSHPAYEALSKARRNESLVPLGKLVEVDVGIVTGRNSFFVLNAEQRAELDASDYTVPIIGRTSALKSIRFGRDDFAEYRSNHPAYLLNLKDTEVESMPAVLKNYLEIGKQHGVHRGYKCRMRKRWLDVPSVYVPDGFMHRQIHHYPLLVVNEAGATSTDTIHRVRSSGTVDLKRLAAFCFNSLTLAWAEVCGRSYGGGVLELEPREAEELPIPFLDKIDIDWEKVNSLLRKGEALEALDYVDTVVLINGIGFDKKMVNLVRGAWVELRDRRCYRR